MVPLVRSSRMMTHVKLKSGIWAPVLRLIINLIPANAWQHQIPGDVDDLPACGQLGAVTLCDDECLLWSGADRKCLPWMTLSQKVPGHVVGQPHRSQVYVAVRVVGMGWLSAVGETQHLHCNLLRRENGLPHSLPPAAEISRRRPFPVAASRETCTAWMAHIDN